MTLRQTVTLTITLDVDAVEAARLPGHPGSQLTRDDDSDPPVTGLALTLARTSEHVWGEVARRLPSDLDPHVVGVEIIAERPYNPDALDF